LKIELGELYVYEKTLFFPKTPMRTGVSIVGCKIDHGIENYIAP
jgi:hypothetical protein